MLTAVIREEECIGCSRCVPACPVDAILGTNKYLHTVLVSECIGCKLCVAPCPVDCIEMVPLEKLLAPGEQVDKHGRAQKARSRNHARQLRLQQEAQRQIPIFSAPLERKARIRQEIAASLQRTQNKKTNLKDESDKNT